MEIQWRVKGLACGEKSLRARPFFALSVEPAGAARNRAGPPELSRADRN